jgi:DNA-binding CsgD family transcriptional regulator
MKIKTDSYKGYLNSIPENYNSLLKERSSEVIEHFQPIRHVSAHLASVTFLLDYSTMQYLHVGESCSNIMGYTANYLMETGLEHYLSNWHPDDFFVINKIVFPSNLAFLKTIALDEYPEYIFSYNYRLKNPKGEYVILLQRFSYVAGDALGQLAGMIGVAFDITHYKSDTTIVQTIEKCIPTQDGILNELVYKKVHPVLSYEDKSLSKKENEILKLIADGLSSKQIAGKMQLSVNTINNHRRNMLQKTGCKSSSELINYAMKHGLI